MIHKNLLFICMVSASLSLCLSKPTTSADETDAIRDTEFNKIILTSVNEILLGDNSVAANAVPDKDLDYRTKYAAQMLSYMNRSVYPCEDFYEYACGNWKNVIEERKGENKRNNLLDITYKLNDIVDEILQRNDIDDVAPQYAHEFELAKKFYYNCIDAELLPMQRSTEYLEVLQQIGGFPALNTSWEPDNFSWLNMSAHLSNYGVDSLVKEGIIPQYPFPPYFKTPDLGFDIELHYDNIENSSSNAYKQNEKRMRDIFTIYGLETDRIDPLINDIFDFLKQILQIIKQFHENDDECKMLTILSFNESDVATVNEQWFAYYDIAWMGKGNYTDDEDDCCTPCAFLYKKLDIICNEHKAAVANYLSLKFLYHMDARLENKKFQKDHCISSVRSSMKYLMDHLYMTIYFNDNVRNDVAALVKEIRQSLRIELQEADWLDETTREAALLKESTIVDHLGRYEDANMNKRLLDRIKTLQFINGTYEANNLNLWKFRQYMKRYNGLHSEELSNTTKPLELLNGMQVNSFYYNLDNAIYVMAGILLPPLFNKAWPNSMKFGTLGYLLGHELTHGFDTVGAQFDQNGQKHYWWSKKSDKVFMERSDCYAKHYQKYFIPEIKRNVNGEITKDENIADAGGLHTALMAYRRSIKNLSKNSESLTAFYKEERMPGLDLSPEQLFFLGFAQLWCSSYKEADYWKELSNFHTIDKYRVLGAVANNADFAKAYECQLGSKMNPSIEKCDLW